MTDKMLNELFSRDRMWSGFAMPTLSTSQSTQVAQAPSRLRYEDRFGAYQSVMGNHHFQNYSLNAPRQGSIIDPNYQLQPTAVPVVEQAKESLRSNIELAHQTDFQGEFDPKTGMMYGGSGKGGGEFDQRAADMLNALQQERNRLNTMNTMYGGMRY